MNSAKTKVAIIIPSKNRPEYLLRQLNYYARVSSPHPVYIGDASDEINLKKIQEGIKKLKNSLELRFEHLPELGLVETKYRLFQKAQEQYACFIGDDDFQVPNSLTLCAEFLETHPEYASAHGYSVAIRIKNNEPLGEIIKIKDYPRPELSSETAQKRIQEFFSRYYVTIFSVNRADSMRKAWSHYDELTDKGFNAEVLPCALLAAFGKSKRIDCLSLVRQIHTQHYKIKDFFDSVTDPEWTKNYNIFENILFREIIKIDHCDPKDIKKVFKPAFWKFLHHWSEIELREFYPAEKEKKPSFKEKIKKELPFLLPVYKKIKPMISKKRYLHAEVVNPNSPYAKDFSEIKKICECRLL